MSEKEEKFNGINPLDVWQNPFKAGLIKEDAIDRIMEDEELKQALLKLKF